MISNYIKQKVLSTGTGSIQLGDKISGFNQVNDVLVNNSYLFYCLVTGNDKEVGVGKFTSSSNSIERVKIFENIINGVLNSPALAPLATTTSSVFFVGNSTQAQNYCIPSWKSDNVPLRFSNDIMVGGLGLGTLSTDVDYCLGNISASNLIFTNSNLKLSFYVSNTVNELNSIELSLTYSYGANNTFVNEVSINSIISSSPSVGFRHKVTFDLGLIGLKDSELLFNLKRLKTSSNDTYSGDLLIHSARLEYQINKFAGFNDIANQEIWE